MMYHLLTDHSFFLHIQSHFTPASIHLLETLLRANGENHYEQDETVGENCAFLQISS